MIQTTITVEGIAQLQELIAMEQTVRDKVNKFRDKLYHEIKETAPMEGVKPYPSDSGIRAAVVSLSAIKNDRRMILDPCYYIQEKQAEIVKDGLRGTDSAAKTIERIQEMYQKKAVRVGAVSYQLNEVTLSVLGKYLANACINK